MKKSSFYAEISKNETYSIFLVISVFLFLSGLGYLIGEIYGGLGFNFMIFGIIISVIFIAVSLNYSEDIILTQTNAKEADKKDERYFVNIAQALCVGENIPVPKLYVINSDEINAFAAGKTPDKSIIGVTKGALKKLNRTELEGVIAHEISHIKNKDTLFMTLTAILVGSVVFLSEIFLRSMRFHNIERRKRNYLIIIAGIILAIIAPILVRLIYLMTSRKRELLADASAVKLTRYPDGLASALIKIKKENRKDLEVSKGAEQLFIVNPFNSKKMENLLSTHPDIDERIKILKGM